MPPTAPDPHRQDHARVIMLGTGTPRPDPNRSGPALAVVANGAAYLVDFGPGVVRRAMAAYQNGAPEIGFGAVNLTTAFLTHLHSDHTLGLPDLILTPWIMGRKAPLTIFGPPGLKTMVEHVRLAWSIDIDARSTGDNRRDPNGCQVRAIEIEPGRIYQDANVTVTAFPVRHEELDHAFGFKFETPSRTIVISGDTAPTPALVEHSRGCDVLVHDVYSLEDYESAPENFKTFRRRNHTSSTELAAIARDVQPKTLVLTHRGGRGTAFPSADMDEALLAEIRATYSGTVFAAKDLDVY